MKVVLTRKLAERVDGVDLSKARVGEVMTVSRREAELLIAEGWAQQSPRRRTPQTPAATPETAAPSATPLETPRPLAGSAPPQPPEFRSIAPTIDRIRELREELELQRLAEQDRRRAEDRFREELRDSRARTVSAH